MFPARFAIAAQKNKNLTIIYRCIILVLVFVIVQFTNGMAQGNLLVTPKRVVFDGSRRSEDLNLANIGKDTATYIISFIQIRMKEDGTFEKITEPDSAQNFADKYLRFYPRTVTLAPNEAQTVKVQITRSNELNEGEYRSHLYFRAIPNDKPLGEETIEKDSSISVKLIPIFGVSIPAIIRKGSPELAVQLSDATFQMVNDTVPALKVTFNRTGNMSVYGDIAVDHISDQGKITRVGVVKGLAVYTPNNKRNFSLALQKVPGVNYRSGKLHVVYSDQSGKANLLAENTVILN